MDIQTLRENPDYSALAEQQKVWLVSYIQSDRDATKAAQEAYPNAKSHKQIGYQNLHNPRLDRLIRLYYAIDPEDGHATKEEVLRILSQQIRAKGKDTLGAIKTYVQLKGWGKDDPDNPPVDPEEQIRQAVKELEQ